MSTRRQELKQYFKFWRLADSLPLFTLISVASLLAAP
jgi:hypothetical protein